MGPPSCMWSVVDQNVIMQRTTVHFRGRTDPCPWPPRGWQHRWLLAYLSHNVFFWPENRDWHCPWNTIYQLLIPFNCLLTQDDWLSPWGRWFLWLIWMCVSTIKIQRTIHKLVTLAVISLFLWHSYSPFISKDKLHSLSSYTHQHVYILLLSHNTKTQLTYQHTVLASYEL